MDVKINRKCIDCGIDPPVTEGPITLMSVQHGWRLVRAVDVAGQTVMEWRCAQCWALYRDKAGARAPR
jgi:hypothetical protein